MCGIAGFCRWPEPHALDRMVELQAHRGPDDRGAWSEQLADGRWVGLGATRLAIQDLSRAGHMPMACDDGSIRITYNGEVYNFPELRREMEARGHRFRSHTDTEVVLRLYQEMGPDCVERLEGMFAFAIWDDREQRLFMARDPFGVKPLYYTRRNGGLGFASEVKALLALPGVEARVDPESLHKFLTFLWVPDPDTMFEGIHKLPPGHSAVFDGDGLSIREYWDLTFPPAGHRFEEPFGALEEEFRSRFGRAVRSQMISDVPVGAFLSAGLDSTSILAEMSAASDRPVSTYNINYPARYRKGEVTRDDPRVVREVANRFGASHQEIVVDPQVAELLPELVWHLDEPIADPAAIAAFLVNREASSQTTVLLSGIGGDELFAGYRKHVAHELAKLYQKIPGPVRSRVIEPLVMALPAMRGSSLKGYVRLAKKMARSGSLPPIERFLTDSTYFDFRLKGDLYTAGLRSRLQGVDPWETHRTHFERVRHADFLNQMLYLDTKTFMVSLNLTYNDKMSMASSMEVRVPFLDRTLAEFAAWSVSPRDKLRGRVTKHLVREAMADVLPESVIRAKKAGFGAPTDYWLANDLRPMVDELLNEETVRRRGFFQPGGVRRLIEEQRRGKEDWSLQIWALLTFELWLRAFVDADAEPARPRDPIRLGVHSPTVGS